MARICGIAVGPMRLYYADLLFSLDLEAGQDLVHLGVFSGSGAGGERWVYVLYAICLSRISPVYRTGRVPEQARDALVPVACADDFHHIACGFGLAVCQFQVVWLVSKRYFKSCYWSQNQRFLFFLILIEGSQYVSLFGSGHC